VKNPKVNVKLLLSDWTALMTEGDDAHLAYIYVSIKEQLLAKKSVRAAIFKAQAATESAAAITEAFRGYASNPSGE
jgi:hypothetical protein